MRKKQLFLTLPFILIAITFCINSCVKDQGKLEKTTDPVATQTLCDSLNVKYSTVIHPILVSNCATSGCHDGLGSGPGDLNNYADIKAMFDNGQLQFRVFTLKDMPSTGPLPDSTLQKIQCWMNDNAPNN